MKFRRYSFILYWVIILALLGLFFTNDFGIVDITKTSIIPAVGIDVEGEEVVVTAQIAVPKPSQSGDNIEYTEVQGSGLTIADALNEVNAKTGFYPELQFCKLILLGESCQKRNIFQVLGCFYRKNYSELTALVAMCEGKASEMLSMPTPSSDMTSSAIQRALADELKKSANVSSVSLKDIAVDNFSESAACFMPYVEANKQGTSESGGNGDNVGGDSASGGGSGGEQSGGSGGGSGGGGEEQSGSSGGSSSSSSGGSSNAGQSPVEFTARRTAIFRGGEFVTILDEQQSFALDILKNEVSLAVLPCDTEEYHYTLGMRNADGGASLKIVDDKVELTLSFEATAQIAGIRKVVDPVETASDDQLSPEVIEGAQKEVEKRLASLVGVIVEKDCDILGVTKMLYRTKNSRFKEFEEGLLQNMKVNYKVKIQSAN